VSVRRLLAALLLVTALGSCTTGGANLPTGADPERADARRERQRRDVRAAARTMLGDAERRLPGRTTHSSGGWRGCDSVGIEQYKNFRYLAQAGVDVGAGAAGPPLSALHAVLEDAGFTAAEVSPGLGGGDSTSLAGRHRELTAVFSGIGGTSVGPVIGLDVYGPCVDVPEGDRDAWLRREETTPDLLAR
jgi:hypothetical protein